MLAPPRGGDGGRIQGLQPSQRGTTKGPSGRGTSGEVRDESLPDMGGRFPHPPGRGLMRGTQASSPNTLEYFRLRAQLRNFPSPVRRRRSEGGREGEGRRIEVSTSHARSGPSVSSGFALFIFAACVQQWYGGCPSHAISYFLQHDASCRCSCDERLGHVIDT